MNLLTKLKTILKFNSHKLADSFLTAEALANQIRADYNESANQLKSNLKTALVDLETLLKAQKESYAAKEELDKQIRLAIHSNQKERALSLATQATQLVTIINVRTNAIGKIEDLNEELRRRITLVDNQRAEMEANLAVLKVEHDTYKLLSKLSGFNSSSPQSSEALAKLEQMAKSSRISFEVDTQFKPIELPKPSSSTAEDYLAKFN